MQIKIALIYFIFPYAATTITLGSVYSSFVSDEGIMYQTIPLNNTAYVYSVSTVLTVGMSTNTSINGEMLAQQDQQSDVCVLVFVQGSSTIVAASNTVRLV